MPTYEYLCQTCSHRFEVWQKMTDEPLQICPECGNHIRRVLYPAGILFKGSGFYKTDHGNGSFPNGKKAEESSNGTKAAGESSNGTKAAGESKHTESGTSNSSSSASGNKVPAGTST